MNRHLLLLTAFLLLCFISSAQKIVPVVQLKSGELRAPENVSQTFLDSFNRHAPRYLGKAYALLQFHTIPTPELRSELAQKGVDLINYVPQQAYTATITLPADWRLLQQAGVRAVVTLLPQQKMHAALPKGAFPDWAVKVPGTVDVLVQWAPAFSFEQVQTALAEKNITLTGTDLKGYQMLTLRIAVNRLSELAAYPFIEYVQPAPPPAQPLNLSSRNGSRSNRLNAAVADGGRGLNGEGVVIGIGDNADIQQHIDFSGRLINRAAANHETHGTHVSGTAAGGGIISEGQRGYAARATVISQVFTGILANAPTYVQDHGMVVTNNSYGNAIGCDFNGQYDLYAHIMDRQAYEMPHLQHVFAAGNSGNDACGSYVRGFGTVLGGFQSAKNVISVGSTFADGALASGSSKGPVLDGRVKPEITAMGSGVSSTTPNNNYGGNSGTSMAAPAVSGGLALLYQRYRQLHGGANPTSDLMKALLCNGAADKGNAGPDYSYGFGWLDLQRSLHMLEQTQYFTGTVTHGAVQTHSINVPANAAAVKVMLYWHDPAAAPISSQALVHNLDLEVEGAGSPQLPQVLNTAPQSVVQPSAGGVDALNNIEQVTLLQPAAGRYTVRVRGTTVAQNPAQAYVVVYDIIEKGTQLTFPAGGEALVPGEKITVQWDAYGDALNPFHLQYSADGGATWTEIKSNIAATDRQFVWEVPNTVTADARLRLQQGSHVRTSGPFTVIGVPQFSFSAAQCEGYINMTWPAVAGAADYEVLMLRGAEMTAMATTTDTEYTFSGLSKDSTYWVTVRARVGGKSGRRANARSRQPATGNCAGNLSDNDLKLAAVISPATGRAFTSSALTAETPVTIEVKNLDNEPVTGFTVAYAVNNGPWQTEVVAATVGAGATYRHTFQTRQDFSQYGAYTIKAAVTNATADGVTVNDTLVKEIRQLRNEPVNVSNSFWDDVEAAAAMQVQGNATGLGNLERYDFESSTAWGRLRTFVNTGMAHSGSKAFTLDASRTVSTGNTNYLTGTFNFAQYAAAQNDLRLSFQFSHHGQITHAGNRVWIRGSDTAPWIPAYVYDNNVEKRGLFAKTRNIEISNLLAAAGQEFSASFQIRWGQFGHHQTTDSWGSAGFTIDDIRLFEAVNDLQVLSIQSPDASSCGLGQYTPVQIVLYNSANTPLTQVPVKFRLNAGAWVQEVVPSIAARDTMVYTFQATADVAAPGAYQLQALVDFSTDNYRDNDTATLQLINSPVIGSYPYLQTFEKGPDHWYTGGKNSSWALGTPASEKIRGAASGTAAWKTRLAGNYNDNEFSYLYSPCFNTSSLQQPMLSFSVALDMEDCGNIFCDGGWVEYSVDGKTWQKLTAGSSTNWYNKTAAGLWSVQNYTRWHVATSALPKAGSLRLRFVFSSDPAVNHEGMAIDDVHIYEGGSPIYSGSSTESPIVQTVSGTDWVHFEKDGQRIASIMPNGNNLGATAVQAYLFRDSVRSQNRQYYHARSLTIKPAIKEIKDSVTVRFYFLDEETDSLVLAKNCAGCQAPQSAYDLGVTQYSDVEAGFENGTLRDNHQGLWNFMRSDKVAIVPYEKGYYAEFRVAQFSEFWLNSGGLSGTAPLPLKLLNFTARKSGADVLLQWTTAAEDNLIGFDIEMARGSAELQQNRFEKLGEAASKGNSQPEQQYTFTDSEVFKTGTRYYRLKIKESNGSVKYSPVRSVVFAGYAVWQIYPNPSTGIFNLVYQADAGQRLHARVTDLSGRVLTTYNLTATGHLQKLEVNLALQPAGIYLLQVTGKDKKEVYKLYRQ